MAKLFSKKEPLLDIENSESIQTAEDPKIRGSLSEKHALERKPMVYLDSLLLVPLKDQKVREYSEMRHLTLFQQAVTLLRFSVAVFCEL